MIELAGGVGQKQALLREGGASELLHQRLGAERLPCSSSCPFLVVNQPLVRFWQEPPAGPDHFLGRSFTSGWSPRSSLASLTLPPAIANSTLLRASGHGVTSAAAAGATGGVHVLFTIVERKRIQHVFDMIEQFDPETFYVVEDVRSATRGVFPTRPRRSSARLQTETPRSIPA